MPDSNPMPQRAPSLILLLGVIPGLMAARVTEAPIAASITLALLFAIVSFTIAHRRQWLWSIPLITATALAFWAYGTVRLPTTPTQEQLERPVREVIMEIEIVRILQARSSYNHSTGLARVIEAETMSDLSPDARVFFSLDLDESGNAELLRGVKLRAIGLLRPIREPVEPGSFEGYLKDSGIHHRLERARMLKYLSPPSAFESFCQKMNLRFQETLRLGAPEPHQLDGIYIAMLLGEKAELDDAQKDRFRMTGTMHFFAISGLHIGVIATVIAQFLILLRTPRKWSPFIGLPLLYLYVEITGASPSAVRAFLMALFFWLSFAFARQRSPLSALGASAVFVLIFDPSQLWSLGFQLSYTVVLSILLFGLPLYEKASAVFEPFRYLPKANWARWQHAYAWSQKALLLLFSVSFSAWLASAPLSAAMFGYLSPGAVFLNMALVNLAALSISAGIISLSFGLFGVETLATFVNHAAWLTIHSMDQLVTWSSQLPGMILRCEDYPHWLAYSTLGLYFGLVIWIQRRRVPRGAFAWFLPVGAVLFGLIFGFLSGNP